MKLTLSELNACDVARFVAVCGPLFEHSPWIAEQTLRQRPFVSRDDLHRALVATMQAASPEEQLALVRAHPDLVGRAARPGQVTAESAREQEAAGLGALSAAEVQRFTELNAAYQAKFGFPLVICARENTKEAILAAFAARLANTREQELATALAEIAKIARLRLLDAVEEARMNVRLAAQSYGKSSVRLTKVTRHAERHELIELAIDIALEGDFAGSYLTGDNRRVIATDTMKNTVYALAADHPLSDPESFLLTLAAHSVERNAHATAATVTAAQTAWERIAMPAGPHRHSFVGGGCEQRTCRVRHTRTGTTIQAGLSGLPLLKTADSAFRGFPRDEFTTLAETDDRIFATLLDAEWTYDSSAPRDWNAAFDEIQTALVRCFADHRSLAVQQTLFAMGTAALAARGDIQSIRLAMPNQHRLPVNLQPLGKANRNEIFVATSEPFGLITATLEREAT